MPWYIGLYAIGIVASVISPIEQIEKTIGLIAPITLTALIASLLVPFAGFSDPEKAQKVGGAVRYRTLVRVLHRARLALRQLHRILASRGSDGRAFGLLDQFHAFSELPLEDV